MNKYNAILGMKLKEIPPRMNVMRSLVKNNEPVEEDLLMKLKLADDAEYQSKERERQEIKELN